MAIEVYRMSDREKKEKLFSIDEETFSSMEDIFKSFKKLTGLYIDPYADNRIYCDHLKLLYSITLEWVKTSKSISKKVVEFNVLIDQMVKEKSDILMVGD